MSMTTSCSVADISQVNQILSQLQMANFSNRNISLLFPENEVTKTLVHEKHSKAPEGAATGGGTGALVGGILGWLAGVGSLAIPGVGPFIAAGPIMAALSGTAIGAAVGGVTGALVGLGVPEYEAKIYESQLKEGRILISVHTEDYEKEKIEFVKKIFKEADADEISAVKEEHF